MDGAVEVGERQELGRGLLDGGKQRLGGPDERAVALGERLGAVAHELAPERAEALGDEPVDGAGGLRALAAGLGIKQATFLSHIATGRLAIPFERAEALASTLGLDASDFCLAVLRQRHPSVYQTLDEALDLQAIDALSDQARKAIPLLAEAKAVTEDHVAVIGEVLSSSQPRDRWVTQNEARIINLLRQAFPHGAPDSEMRQILDFIEAYLNA